MKNSRVEPAVRLFGRGVGGARDGGRAGGWKAEHGVEERKMEFDTLWVARAQGTARVQELDRSARVDTGMWILD